MPITPCTLFNGAIRCKIHGFNIGMFLMRVSHVNAEIANPHTRSTPPEEIVGGERIADGVQVGHGHSSSAQLACTNK